MYCMHCQKNYQNEMFCPECGRMLVNEYTFLSTSKFQDEQNRIVNEEQKRFRDKEIQDAKDNEKLIPKCPICGSTKLNKLSALNRTVSFGIWGFGSNKVGKTYQCNNCKATF